VSLELRNAEEALQGNAGGERGTSTAGVASSVGGRRREEEADEEPAMPVVLSEGTPEATRAATVVRVQYLGQCYCTLPRLYLYSAVSLYSEQ
jgi:hypothetical protein